MTCFNRKASTLTCLDLLARSCQVADVSLHAILVDDASTDGTAEAVKKQFDWVTVLHGDGNLFWNRGMHQAMHAALKQNQDFILWINDDTHLLPDAIETMLKTSHSGLNNHPVMVVGATADRVSGKLTYGGQVRVSALRRFAYRKVWSPDHAVACDVMNGNLVLIPQQIASQVGNIDPVYEHAMGDIDYALRAKAAGFALMVAPGFVGHCANNPTTGTHMDGTLPIRQRWKKMLSRKGVPVKSWLHFTKKHGGLLWPVYFAWPYFKFFTSSVLK